MKKLEKTGAHVNMSPDEIEQWSELLKQEHETYLSKYGVMLPANWSLPFYWLIYLRKYKWILVHKDTIASFVASFRPDAWRDQQIRHLAAKWWYILNKGEKLMNVDDIVPSGFHVLITTDSPKPTFIYKSLKRSWRVAAASFEQLKAVYDFRCATCWSQEGRPHLIEPDKRTSLQQGHMDPFQSLTLTNTIPQCQVCNQVYQDKYVFDTKWRIVSVASVEPVRNARPEVKKGILEYLMSNR